MTISDAVVGNLTVLYLAVIVAIKAYSHFAGRSYGGGFVLILSTAVISVILVGALVWDVSRKAAATFAMNVGEGSSSSAAHEMCRGGICWHGVAVKSPASQVRFRLPQQYNLINRQ